MRSTTRKRDPATGDYETPEVHAQAILRAGHWDVDIVTTVTRWRGKNGERTTTEISRVRMEDPQREEKIQAMESLNARFGNAGSGGSVVY